MRCSLLLLLALVSIGSASAQTYLSPTPQPYSIADKFRLELDLFRASYDTVIRMDSVVTTAGGTTAVIPGTVVSGETDLGLASTQYLGQVELTLLPGESHMVRLSALSMRRDGNQILTRTINWNGSIYRTGERVDSHLNLTMSGLTYGYFPFRTDRYELGLSFGIQIASVNANAEVRSRSIRAEESAVGPIPLLGIEGSYEFTRHWSVDARFQYLSLGLVESLGVDVDNVEGTITDWRLAVRFRQNQHLLYGLGYRHFNLEVVSPSSDPPGFVTLATGGLMLFMQASL